MITRISGFFLCVLATVAVSSVWAAESVVEMHKLTKEGTADTMGTVTIKETEYGTLFIPKLSGLTEGLHGFHVHVKDSCGPGEKDGKTVPGLAAGGHLDPQQSNSHKGPYADGHLGDLPALYVDATGTADHPLLAPRVHLSDIKGHALMIHQDGDNYADTPKPLGGGGARVACGVIH